jgi:hypothetical protein
VRRRRALAPWPCCDGLVSNVDSSVGAQCLQPVGSTAGTAHSRLAAVGRVVMHVPADGQAVAGCPVRSRTCVAPGAFIGKMTEQTLTQRGATTHTTLLDQLLRQARHTAAAHTRARPQPV